MLYKKIIIIMLMFLPIVLICNSSSANAIDTMETNLDMSIADIIMVIVSCGIIVIVAFDARIALMCAILIYTSIFIVFTLATEEGFTNFNPYLSGVAMMLCFVILVISLLVTYKKVNTPLNVV